jgi:hypothetical protein
MFILSKKAVWASSFLITTLNAAFIYTPASSASPIHTIEDCTQSTMPILVDDQSPYAKLDLIENRKPYSGWFLLDTGTTNSSVDLKALAATAPSDGARNFTPEIFNFFGNQTYTSFWMMDYSRIRSVVRQAGIIGTDFLSEKSIAFDYINKKLQHLNLETLCTEADLQSWGMESLQSDTSKINVPTVPIQIAGIPGQAQLDSGYNDSYYLHSININLAYKQKLDQAGIHLIPHPRQNQTLTTCMPGIYETVETYSLPHGKRFNFVTTQQTEMQPQKTVNIFVKNTPPAAKICGGISTWTEPAAQLGGSFMNEAGLVVLDPHRQKVWFKKQPQ